jgi:hypothetical protein
VYLIGLARALGAAFTRTAAGIEWAGAKLPDALTEKLERNRGSIAAALARELTA